jgi:hypothetical protein
VRARGRPRFVERAYEAIISTKHAHHFHPPQNIVTTFAEVHNGSLVFIGTHMLKQTPDTRLAQENETMEGMDIHMREQKRAQLAVQNACVRRCIKAQRTVYVCPSSPIVTVVCSGVHVRVETP